MMLTFYSVVAMYRHLIIAAQRGRQRSNSFCRPVCQGYFSSYHTKTHAGACHYNQLQKKLSARWKYAAAAMMIGRLHVHSV